MLCEDNAIARTTGEHWAVVGGGILGMTTALRLAQRGIRVTLIEGRQQLGGLADAWQLGDVTWDRHYHVTLLSDLNTRALIRELELEDQMQWVQTKTGFFTDGKLHSMSSTPEFLRFPPLRMIDKLRLGGTIFYASHVKDWQRLEQIPVADWLTQLSGKRTFQKIWLPLLRSKLGDSWKETSAAFIWATIARMYAARRTGLKREMFGYVRGGYATVLDRFTEKLQQAGVTIRCNAAVRCIRSADKGRVTIHLAEESPVFDRVVCTLPAAGVTRLCHELTENEKSLFNGIQYHGIICGSVLTRRSLSPYYVTNLTDGNSPFTAVIEMTSLVNKAELNGHALIYLPKYVKPDDEAFEKHDSEIEHEFLTGLQQVHPEFSMADVVAFRVSRARHVFALPTLNYSRRLPPISTSVPNLFAVSSAHILNGTLNVNESIHLAEEFVRQFADTAPQSPSAVPHQESTSRIKSHPSAAVAGAVP